MFSFIPKQKSAFGLDISGTTVRLMELGNMGKGFFPTAFSEAALPKGVIQDDLIVNHEAVGDLIAQTRHHPTFGQFSSPYVVLSVPESKSFVRVITVPKMSEKEAEEAVPFEAEQYIPLTADQVYLDFRIVSGRRDPSSDKMRVMIVATPKNVVDNYLKAVKKAGLKPVAIEVESEAVARCLVSYDKNSSPTLIVDMSALRTNLIIADIGSVQFTSSLPVAGNSFTAKIAEHLSVSAEEAEKLKLQRGLVPAQDGGKVRAAVLPLLNSLIEAVENTINFYHEHSEGSREIGRIILCGGGSKLRGLGEYVAGGLAPSVAAARLPGFVQVGDPWINVLEHPIKKVPPISKADSVSYTTVIGLALRGIGAG